MDRLPNRVALCECWARDGIQGETEFIPTEKKIGMINRMASIGFRRIEVTSFAHPKLVRQFSDAMEVLEGIDRPEGVTYISVVPNEKALDRLLDACNRGYPVHEITAIVSASEAHLLANMERTFAEVMPSLSSIVKRARAAGLKVIGCVGTSFGCPLAGEVPFEKVAELAEWYLAEGATSIMPGDTTGEANPRQVREFYRRMRERFPGVEFISHFHDTRGMGLANTLAALQEGIVHHDGSLGGIGGQPATRRPKYHRGFSGNTCTEDMIVMMSEMGIDTGIRVPDVIELGLAAEEVLGRRCGGHVTRSGPVRHRSPTPLSLGDLKPGMEIPPSLGHRVPRDAGDGPGGEDAVGETVREALANVWPLPDGFRVHLEDVEVHWDPRQRSILLTRFDVLEVHEDRAQALVRVLSQMSNGDVAFEGRVRLDFHDSIPRNGRR